MKAVEEGDLTQTISTQYRGQFELLRQATNNTASRLAQTVSETPAATDQLMHAANQISSASQSLSQSATEQASSKGFAVVPSEVGKLAERSSVAAEEIGELAATSVHTAERAGTLLSEIVPSIERTSHLVQEVAAASAEQTSGITQINLAMTQMNQITPRSPRRCPRRADRTGHAAPAGAIV